MKIGFIHIPKTGGSTVCEGLAQVFSWDVFYTDHPEKAHEYDLLCGHVNCPQAFRLLPRDQAFYFTFVRDPVGLFESWRYWAVNLKRNAPPHVICPSRTKAARESWEAFLDVYGSVVTRPYAYFGGTVDSAVAMVRSFDFVGKFEDMDNELDRLAKALGVHGRIKWNHRNTNPDRSPNDGCPPEIAEQFKQRFPDEFEFYERVLAP